MSKEDKIIKDLKKRNDSLKSQFEMVRMREIHYENKSTRLEEENKHLKDLQRNMDKQYEKLENNWNELKKWLEEYEENSYGLGSYETGISDALSDVLKKMQELESNND